MQGDVKTDWLNEVEFDTVGVFGIIIQPVKISFCKWRET